MKQVFRFSFLFLFLFLAASRPAHADSVGLIFRGLAKTIFSAFQIPAQMARHSGQVLFPFGILTGAVDGSARTIMGTLSGAADMARGAAPYAKYMVFFI